MNIKILYEDKNLLAINKPAGLPVHPDGKSKEKTLVDWIMKEYPEIKNVGENIKIETQGNLTTIYRPGIVHRLDKETSGVLIIAKNNKTFSFLKEQFKNHKVEKVYQAFVYGSVAEPKTSLAKRKRGVINVPVGRSPKDIRMWTAGRGARPPLRQAITEYIILSKFRDNDNNLYSYLEIYPKTGRTHQIRIHMRYINHPIVSDSLYKGKRENALGINRLALHARSINFQLPNGEIKKIEAPYPNDFNKVIKDFIG